MRQIKQPAFPFVNAQELAVNFPDTFEAPSAEELAEIHRGQYVKVCVPCGSVVFTQFDSERFWVTVESVDGDTITGEVDNDLVFTAQHGLQYGDMVQFKLENVYAIYD